MGLSRTTEPNLNRTTHQPPPPPPNPDDEPVKGGVLRDLLDERQHGSASKRSLRDHQAREQERAAPAGGSRKPRICCSRILEAFKKQMQNEYRKEIANVQLETDMQMASMRHGPLFDAAWQHFHASCQDGADPVSYFRVMNARSPARKMVVRWFNERRVMHETQGDINGYRHRVAQQLLQDPDFLAHAAQLLQNGGVPPPQQQQQPRPGAATR